MMIITDRLNTTTSSTLVDVDIESRPLCWFILPTMKHGMLGLAIFIMSATLVIIPSHRRLRKRHHIFPYNLVLSDFCGAIVFAVFEGTGELPLEYVEALQTISVTSFIVSLLSIVLVAGYQFITIRVDPFGAQNIITTPRLIIACLLTWAFSFSISVTTVLTISEYTTIFTLLLCISLITTTITGFCYVLIYRSVAKVPCEGNITAARKEENQRVLRTFGLVFGTTVVCWICPWVHWAFLSLGFEYMCLFNAGDMMICANWIANCVIYWWRLKEFRAIFSSSAVGIVDVL
ncbi:cannabinoid receptor 2-like [Lytechinus variegatus]|uniref:cannabinoid receptor 2-like n=1 Tax=Lytechinus variegatus TaxID=7654 RepID=UPI001BB2CAC0|nr:cannabinoid receptor 2-like [Lytechinus variegatus]